MVSTIGYHPAQKIAGKALGATRTVNAKSIDKTRKNA